MLLPKFDYHSPASLEEACRLLAAHGDQASLLAGGTDLLVAMKNKHHSPAQVISLDQVPGLRGIRSVGADVEIGALTTAADLAKPGALTGPLAALAQAARWLGSPLVRNLATLGGNLAQARPAADLAPPLLALRASVIMVSSRGQRELPLEDFFVGPGQTRLQDDEILTAFRIPAAKARSEGAFLKLGPRKALERSIVSVAVVISLSESGDEIVEARVALGAVAPTPRLSPKAAAVLNGAPVGEKTFADAAVAARGDACPRGRCSSPEYSLEMVEVLTRRALAQACATAGAAGGKS